MKFINKAPRDLAQATGTGSATINFQQIGGEVDQLAAYLSFLPKASSYDSYIQINISRDKFNQGLISLPSSDVDTYIKLGASGWSADAGHIECRWNEELRHITGSFNLINSDTQEEISAGFFDVTFPTQK